MATKGNSPPKPKGFKAPLSPQASASKPATDEFERVADARRVKDATSARTIYNRLIQDNTLRSATYATVRNQLEGGRPRDPADLEQNGESWSCNVNFGDAQAQRNRILQPFWKMVNDVPHRASFTIDAGSPQTGVWEAAFSECFDEFHEDWGADYYQQFMQTVANYINFGPGLANFTTSQTARYKAVNPTRVLFPKNANMSPDTWEVVAFTRDMSMTELYAYVRDAKAEKTNKDAGWNPDAIKATIVQAQPGGPPYDYRDYTRLSDQLVNNDIMITTPFMPQAVVWLYVKQFDGNIGCYVFTPYTQSVNDFLFMDLKIAKSFRELLPGLWYDTGTDGMVHSIKGFGIKNFHFSVLLNRMKSRMCDSATFSLGVNFQYQDGNTPDETPPVENYGAYSVFPRGLTQLAIYPQLKAASDVMGILENNAAENNSLYKQNNEEIAQTDTATQANILANIQGQTAESSAAIFLAQLGENFYTEQVRRLRMRGNKDADAEKFVRRLKDRGVPDNVIFETEIRVKTGANAGNWNPAVRAQQFQEGLALSSIPGVNTRWFLENLIAYKYGAYAVNKGLLPEGSDSNPIQRREAKMENMAFGQGIPLTAAVEDDQVAHMEEHLKPASGILAQAKQGAKLSPEQIGALTTATEHMGEHMSFLSKDQTQKAAFTQLVPQFRLISSMTRGILAKMQQGGSQNGGSSGPQGQGGGAPGGGSAKESISINYKDAPPSIRRQMEQAAGFQPAVNDGMVNGAQ